MGRRVVGLLERLGMGPRVLKTAIAASLAWWIGNLLGEPQPVLAAVAAIVGLEPTVASSLARAGEQLVGMLAGLALAAFMLRLSGSAPLAVFLLILLATTIGARLRLRQAVIVEFSITALVVVTFTDVTHPYYGITRIWEGVLGGALAVAVNALILPPEYHGQLRGLLQRSTTITLEALRWGLDDLLDGASADVAADHYGRVADELGRLAAEREALERARDALRFSPLRRQTRAPVERLARGVEHVERILDHAHGTLRVAWQHARRAARPHPLRAGHAPAALAVFRDSLQLALEQYALYLTHGRTEDAQLAAQTLAVARAARQGFLSAAEIDLRGAGELESRVDLAAVESELEHVLEDLGVAVDRELAALDLPGPSAAAAELG